jgi:diaminobutyrate-2-oxoglutarate transaminase
MIMFPGPTGTNAVEAALKIARKVTGKKTIIFFKNGFHGVTLGSLAVTANQTKRNGAGVPLRDTFAIPFERQFEQQSDTFDCLHRFLERTKNSDERPAAVILETVQAEGGPNAASIAWLQRLERWVREHNLLFIVDDIQVGCGRTGPFFSFERAGLKPDLVCLSKSISGYGIPMSLVLINPDLDCWQPGEHNGTFRGHNLAFVTATAALDEYWQTDTFQTQVQEKADLVKKRLNEIMKRYSALEGECRGLGLIQGIACHSGSVAKQVSQAAFKRGLIIETAGIQDEVIKLLPPLTIELNSLIQGLNILEESIDSVLSS